MSAYNELATRLLSMSYEDCDAASARLLRKLDKPAKRKWRKHDGSGMPCAGDLLVDVKFADGDKHKEDPAHYWDWPHIGDDGSDIVAWRPSKGAVEAKPAEQAVADADGWIAHDGGPCPVDKSLRVDTRFTDGTILAGRPAVFPAWKGSGRPYSITHYRISSASNAGGAA